MVVPRPEAGNFRGCSFKILWPVVGGPTADPEDRDRVTGVFGNDEICSARATAGLSLLDDMDCLGPVVDGVQQVDGMLDIFDTHFVQASVDSISSNDEICSARATAGLSLLDDMDCLGPVVDGVQQLDDMLDIFDTHFGQASVDFTRQGESVDTSSICGNIAGNMGPGGNGVRQADETSNSSVTHCEQASEASVKVAKSVDSGDIGDNIANYKDVVCRAFNFNSAGDFSVPITINGVFMTAILDTGAQVTVVCDAFVRRRLAGLKFSGAYNSNGIKSDAPFSASQSEEVDSTIGDSSYRWKFLKAAITDNCILGLDFIAHFKLDIKLSENTLVLVNSTIPIQVSAMQAKGSYTMNTVSLFKES